MEVLPTERGALRRVRSFSLHEGGLAGRPRQSNRLPLRLVSSPKIHLLSTSDFSFLCYVHATAPIISYLLFLRRRRALVGLLLYALFGAHFEEVSLSSRAVVGMSTGNTINSAHQA